MAVRTLGDLDKTSELVLTGDGYRTADDVEIRLDFADIGVGNIKPVYIGTAPAGAASSASTWLIQKITWTNVTTTIYKPTRIQTLTGVWDDRASLGW